MGNDLTFLKHHHAILAASSPKLASASGTQSISMPNAVSMPLKSLKVEGSSTQSATPSPSAPVDIECSNGTLVPRHESGLPLEYTLLDSIGCNSSHDITTSIYLASTDVVECRFRNSTTTGYGALYGTYAVGDSSAFYANGTYYGYNVANSKVDTDINVDANWHTLRHDFINGEITIDEVTTTFTPFTFTNSKAMHIFSRYYNGSYGYYWKGYISYFRVYRNGELICDYIPAKYNGDVGVYDLVNEEFLSGTSILEGSAIDDPVTAVTTGTPNTVALNSQTANVADLLAVGDYKDEQDIISGNIMQRIGVKILDGTEEWTTDTYGGYRRMVLQEVLNASGDTLPVVCTYYISRSADARQQPNSIFIASSGKLVIYVDSTQTLDTVTDFQNYLATQYAAGTPVIVLYPLATETIEHKSPTVLRTIYNATNTITTTENITVEYWRKPF